MQADDLDGTRWALEYLTLDGVSHMVSGRRIPEISFLDGSVWVDDGVNRAHGPYRLDAQGFSTDVSASTKVAYPAEALPEHGLLGYLGTATTATVHGDFLHLAFDGGELVYRWEEDEEPA